MRDRAPMYFLLPPFLWIRAADLSRLPLVWVRSLEAGAGALLQPGQRVAAGVGVAAVEWPQRVSGQGVAAAAVEWPQRVSGPVVAAAAVEWPQRVQAEVVLQEVSGRAGAAWKLFSRQIFPQQADGLEPEPVRSHPPESPRAACK